MEQCGYRGSRPRALTTQRPVSRVTVFSTRVTVFPSHEQDLVRVSHPFPDIFFLLCQASPRDGKAAPVSISGNDWLVLCQPSLESSCAGCGWPTKACVEAWAERSGVAWRQNEGIALLNKANNKQTCNSRFSPLLLYNKGLFRDCVIDSALSPGIGWSLFLALTLKWGCRSMHAYVSRFATRAFYVWFSRITERMCEVCAAPSLLYARQTRARALSC